MTTAELAKELTYHELDVSFRTRSGQLCVALVIDGERASDWTPVPEPAKA